MAQGLDKWSTTAATNATADSTINWSEGQSPSSVNDSSRAMMARLAEYRIYTSGKTDTGGSADAYTFSTGDAGHTALVDGYKITFCVSATNTGAATINVDSLGAKALRFHTGVALPAGALITGSIYTATYDSGADEWRLHSAVNVVNTSNQIVSANGSAAAPSHSFASDPDTGIYRIGANNIGIAANGAKVVDVATTGVAVTGTVSSSGNTSVGGDLAVTGNTALTGTLTVGGTQLVSILPVGVVRGLVCTNNSSTPTTSWDVDAEHAVLLDSNGIPKTVSSVDLTINAATNGAANALDAGSLANDTWYHAFIISNGSTTAGLLSTSATSPTMPSGYTYKLRVGAIKTGGSATFLRVLQKGNKSVYQVVAASTTPNLPIIGSGTAGDTGVPTWSPVTVRGASGVSPIVVPTTATHINVGLFTQGNSNVMAAPNSAYGAYNSLTNPPPMVSNLASAGLQTTLTSEFLLEANTIQWASNGSAGRLLCIGWTDAVLAV